MIHCLNVLQTIFVGMTTTAHFGGGVEDLPRIEGGEVAKTCVSPSTVSTLLGQGWGTGSLVHPRVVVYSAHSNPSNSPIDSIYFGEDINSEEGKKIEVSRCVNHPDWTGSNTEDGVDIGYCLLREAVNDVPIVPIVMGCEVDMYIKPETKVHQVGFGMSQAGQPADKKKRWIANGSIKEVLEKTIKTSNPLGTGPLTGDSGGPLYIQLDDGTWRNAGVLSYGGGDAEEKIANYISIFHYVKWIEEELKDENIDITPCHDADGTWNPTELCKAFPMEPFKGGGSWDKGCEPGKLSGYSATCGPPFDDSETTTTDGTSSTGSTDGDTTDGTSSTEGTDGETTDSTSSTGGTESESAEESSESTESTESSSVGSSEDEGDTGTTSEGTEDESGGTTTTSSGSTSTSSSSSSTETTSGNDTNGDGAENADTEEDSDSGTGSDSTAGSDSEPNSGCRVAAGPHAFVWSWIGLILIGISRRRSMNRHEGFCCDR